MPHLLSLIILLPLAGAAALIFMPKGRTQALRNVAIGVSLTTLAAALLLAVSFREGVATFQFVERASWFRLANFKAEYHLGVDGISLWLVLLTTLLTPLSILASRHVENHVREFLIFLLALETGVLGVFCSLDLVLFYLFWEVMLIPMYFLIGIWGSQNRVYAAIKFFLYTMAGSLLMLVGIIALVLLNGGATGILTASYPDLLSSLETGHLILPAKTGMLLFLSFGLAFAIKVPLFPFHTWLPDAHVEAPTAGSVILAGVLLKMGTYGLLRFCLPLFPEASREAAPWACGLAVVGIVYGALVSMVQPDLKKLVAYSSVSHMGYVVLGTFAFNILGLQGAAYQALNHGISTGALFLLVGMIYDRRHTRLIDDFGGLARVMPVYASAFLVITLSSIGLPLLNGFVGEILILQGAFLSVRPFAIAAASGMILSAVYMLWMYQRVFLGPVTREENSRLKDLGTREKWILGPVLVLAVWMGIVPGTFLRPMEASLQKVVQRVQAPTAEPRPEIREARSSSPTLTAHKTDGTNLQ